MPAEPAVHLVEDPEDSRDLVELVGALTNRLAGRAALHPTPGSSSSLQLASDLLVSLGKRFDALAFERARTRAWELVEIWMAAERVRHLFVLRGHLLAAGRWRELLELARRGGIEAWFVFPGRLPAGVESLLATMSCRRWDPCSFAAHWSDVARDSAAEDEEAEFPEVPAEEFYTFRAACRRLLTPANFERVDRTFCESVRRTSAALEPWKPKPRGPMPPPLRLGDVGVQLQNLLVDSSGSAEALVRLRGAQAAYFREGWLVGFQPPLVPPDSGLVPLGPRLDPATASRLRRLCVPRSTAAMALFLIADLRSVGLSRLDVGDVDDEGKSVCVGPHRFAVPDYARSLVMAQFAERRRNGAGASEPLFVHPGTGQRPPPSALRNVLRGVATKTAISVGVHDSFGTQSDASVWLRAQGITVATLDRVPTLYQ